MKEREPEIESQDACYLVKFILCLKNARLLEIRCCCFAFDDLSVVLSNRHRSRFRLTAEKDELRPVLAPSAITGGANLYCINPKLLYFTESCVPSHDRLLCQ